MTEFDGHFGLALASDMRAESADVHDCVVVKGNDAAGAIFSRDEVHRYALWRMWDPSLPRLLFVMLNPSTATHEVLDPTVAKCIKYAQATGCGTLMVGNLFALRSTDPKNLKTHPNPIGKANDQALAALAERAHGIVVAWGNHGKMGMRSDFVLSRLHSTLKPVLALRKAKTGEPMHPLYLPQALKPKQFATMPVYEPPSIEQQMNDFAAGKREAI